MEKEVKMKIQIKKIILANWSNPKIISINEFPEGYNNLAYDVKLENGNYVIKLLKLKDLERYALKQKHIRKLIRNKFKDFPIAKIIKSDFSKKVINKPYLIAEKIEGGSLQKTYKKVSNKTELYEEIGELYGKLHSFKFKVYGELNPSLKIIKGYTSWYAKRVKKVENIFKKIEENNLLSKEDIEKNKDFFRKNRYLLKKELSPRLCHGDASDTNIIVRRFKGKYHVEGILDFEFSRSSGPTQDLFSGIRSFEKKYRYRKNIIKGYLRFSKLPKEWEKLVFLYNWISNLNNLTNIKRMKWKELNKAKTLIRKERIREKSIHQLRKIRKILKF